MAQEKLDLRTLTCSMHVLLSVFRSFQFPKRRLQMCEVSRVVYQAYYKTRLIPLPFLICLQRETTEIAKCGISL